MRIILALGALAIIGLSGCVEDPYGYGGGYGPGPAYGGGSYGGGYGAPDPSARANFGEDYLESGFDDDPYTVQVTSGGGTDPEVSFYQPQSGVYDVWVGAFGGDSGDAELFITELR